MRYICSVVRLTDYGISPTINHATAWHVEMKMNGYLPRGPSLRWGIFYLRKELRTEVRYRYSLSLCHMVDPGGLR